MESHTTYSKVDKQGLTRMSCTTPHRRPSMQTPTMMMPRCQCFGFSFGWGLVWKAILVLCHIKSGYCSSILM
eukprot:713006-Amphidinium_carterae.1